MNLVEIAGFLGADAEERFTSTGKRVVTLRVATKARQGGKDETIWWRVNIWNDRFDKMLPYLKKGTALIIFGELKKPETYVDKNGHTQVSLTLDAEIVKFSPFGKPDRGEGDDQSKGYASGSRSAPAQEELVSYGAASHVSADSEGFAGDDLPF